MNLLGALTLGLADGMRGAIEEASAETGAAPSALVVLHDLLRGGSVDGLRRSVALTHSGGVRLVDRLAGEGYLERRPGRDARSLSLVLTPAGKRVARRVRDARARTLRRTLQGLSAEERATLTTLIEKMIGAVVSDRLDERAAGGEPAGGWLCRLCDPAACGRGTGTCPAATTAQAALEY